MGPEEGEGVVEDVGWTTDEVVEVEDAEARGSRGMKVSWRVDLGPTGRTPGAVEKETREEARHSLYDTRACPPCRNDPPPSGVNLPVPASYPLLSLRFPLHSTILVRLGGHLPASRPCAAKHLHPARMMIVPASV